MNTNANMPFGQKNYKILLLGIAIMLLGFILMASDPTEFGFGFIGLTLGPLTLLAGFGIQFWAIFTNGTKSDSSERQ